jgi:hypothetical protein
MSYFPSGGFLEFLEAIIKSAFGGDYYSFLKKRITEDDKKSIYSLSDLGEKYPDFKDKIISIAKTKIKTETEGLDYKYEESVTSKFMNFDKGLKLIKPLLDSLISCGFATSSITDAVLSTFTSAVCNEGALFFKEYHDASKKFEQYEVQDFRYENTLLLFYINLEVTSVKIENFLYNESKTTIKSQCKMIKFANLQSLLEWSSTQ